VLVPLFNRQHGFCEPFDKDSFIIYVAEFVVMFQS